MTFRPVILTLMIILVPSAGANETFRAAVEEDWLLRERLSAKAEGDSRIDWSARVGEILAHCGKLTEERTEEGVDVSPEKTELDRLSLEREGLFNDQVGKELYLEARRLQRRLTLLNPLLDFDTILFNKRVPGVYSHMSDQYYGWWSRPGGGIYLLKDFTTDSPSVVSVSDSFPEEGSFLRPILSFDGKRVLFAWCRHHTHVADEKDKLNKDNIPESSFYHLYEMNVDGSNVRQLTSGKYDDFDARYLPDGKIVFLSTRRGQAVQCGPESAQETVDNPDLPDSYVRCGGGPQRPVAVYTLHTMDSDGKNMCAISPFENFEWTPSVAADGTILYSRWDYVDRDNMPYMSMWKTNPDGSNARSVYGNFATGLHCAFEPRSIPNSQKIIFTASGHHAQTMGSLVLLDPTVGTEGVAPITRLTPEVPFPEIEAWPETFYANPWPLSERHYLVAWSHETEVREGTLRDKNGMGIYLLDVEGNMELLHRDPDIGSQCPIPLRPRKIPHAVPNAADWSGPKEGAYLLTDVYRGLKNVERGEIRALRVVAVPAKTHPTMNFPVLGVTRDDPGKCVLGNVPVEEDGSAYFRVPAGVILFFQALDEQGMAVQTMRSTTHVQPGQTLSCVGCHEDRNSAPHSGTVAAALREPSRIEVGPDGSWPLRFDRLIQPVLDQNCVGCHNPSGEDPEAASFDLTSASAYQSLIHSGTPNLFDHVMKRYKQGRSMEGACAAMASPVLERLSDPNGLCGSGLSEGDLERFVVWMDTYAQRLGSFSVAQEAELAQLRRDNATLLIE